MKNPSWDDSSLKTEDEMKAEARRLLSEMEGMIDRMKQTQARTDRLMEENKRTLQRIQERFDVASFHQLDSSAVEHRVAN